VTTTALTPDALPLRVDHNRWYAGSAVAQEEPMTVTDRVLAAMAARDAEAFAACVAQDYRSEQPAHPSRAFTGRGQVLQNWKGVFAGVPDFTAELLTLVATDDVEVGEWVWSGRHTDGSAFEMRGVTVFGIQGDQIAWGRLYMEPVETTDESIEEMVEATYRPPRGAGAS
jgi:ketosteroid isomerase-like protein